jgi:hypothetical protein
VASMNIPDSETFSDDYFEHAMGILNDLAEQNSSNTNCLGFRVFGTRSRYEREWDREDRSPLRWRSGEWILCETDDGFDVIEAY